MKICKCCYCINVRFPFSISILDITDRGNARHNYEMHLSLKDRKVEFNHKTKRWNYLKETNANQTR